MRPWSTSEIRYLEQHAHEGVKAIAFALGRSSKAVESQASRYGLSLRRVWQCPRCGMQTHKPLSERTGWCSVCTKQERRKRIAQEVAELEEEVRREKAEDRKRQRLYSRKNRAKKARRKAN